MTDAFWYGLFGFLGLIVAPVVKELIDRKRAADKEKIDQKRAVEVAAKVQVVADNLVKTTKIQDEKLDVIHEACNGNTARMEDKIESLTNKLTESDKREAVAKSKGEPQ